MVPLIHSWFSESLKKRALRYLLQRYLGHFLLEKLTLDQLSVDLYDGRGAIRDIILDVEGLNEELKFLPFKFVAEECKIDAISVSVPWSALLTESCEVQLEGASFSCEFAMKTKEDFHGLDCSSLLTRSLMTSSMQMAEEIVHQQEEDKQEEKLEGLEMFAQLIDSVLRRVKLTAKNTTFTVKKKGSKGVDTVQFKIKYIGCEEEAPLDAHQAQQENTSPNPNEPSDATYNYSPEAITKVLTLEGVEVYIGDKLITKLSGRHSIKMKFTESRSDVQIFVGSPIFAIFNTEELESFLNVFDTSTATIDPEKRCGIGAQKMMSSADFHRIEEQLVWDARMRASGSQTHFQTRDMISSNENKWAYGGSDMNFELSNNEATFHPIGGLLDDNEDLDSNRHCGQKRPNDAQNFSCQIKIPGLWVCLQQEGQRISTQIPVPFVEDPNSFTCINAFIDDKLITSETPHIRLLALRVALDISNTFTIISCADLMLSECKESKITPFIQSENQSQLFSSSKFRFELRNGSQLSCTFAPNTKILIDPTFAERMHKFLPFKASSTSSPSTAATDFSYEICCDKLCVELLIPVPDLRPERFEQINGSALRDDQFIFNLTYVNINGNRQGFSGRAKSWLGSIASSANPIPKQVLTSISSAPESFIKFNVMFGPKNLMSSQLDELPRDMEMEDSIYLSHTSNRNQQPKTPFADRRKVICNREDEIEIIVAPGEKDHMDSFLENASRTSKINIEFDIPSLILEFDSKEDLELIYNRFGNDLALWTPLVKEDVPNALETSCTSSSAVSQTPPQFYSPMNSMIDSLGSQSSNPSFEATFTVNSPAPSIVTSKFNVETMAVKIGRRFNEASSDADSDLELEYISGDGIIIGFVVGEGKTASNFVCVSGDNLELRHEGVPLVGSNVYCDLSSTLGLAVEIKYESEDAKQKRIKFSLQLKGAALYEAQFEAFKEFWKFVNVTDETVPGYVPAKVLTEVHLNLVNGAIRLESSDEKARPALLAFDEIYLTSMVLEATSQTLLRIIAEEVTLHLKKTRKNGSTETSLKNYVSVVDSGLLDINLKVLDDNSKIEFRVRNNIINFRTCSDSFSALCQLLNSLIDQNSAASVETDSGTADITAGSSFESPDNNVESAIQDAMSEALNDMASSIHSAIEDEGTVIDSDVNDDDFCIMEHELGAGIRNRQSVEPKVRLLINENEQVTLIENHFNYEKANRLLDIIPQTLDRYCLEEMSITWHLFGGKDFDDEEEDSTIEMKKKHYLQQNAKGKNFRREDFNYRDFSKKDKTVKFKNDDQELDQALWESLNLASNPFIDRKSSNSSLASASSNIFGTRIQGGARRQNDVCVQLHCKKAKCLFENFTEEYPMAFRFLFSIQEIEVVDRLTCSDINKMLYEYSSDKVPSRNHAPMASLKLVAHKNTDDHRKECELRTSLKPLRVNIDQDTLLFLVDYFTEVTNGLVKPAAPYGSSPPSSLPEMNSPRTREAVRRQDSSPRASRSSFSSQSSVESPVPPPPKSSNDLYIKSITFTPEVPIHIDYTAKRLDFEQGTVAGLLMGLVQLNNSELRLRRLHTKQGVRGIDRAFMFLGSEWTQDIRRNQLPLILGGVGPMHSFIQLFQGIKDLVWMPIEQYRKDKRIIRGLQKGAYSFSNSSALAAIDLTSRLVYIVQQTAQFAQDVVSPANHASPRHGYFSVHQARDITGGVGKAIDVMRTGAKEMKKQVMNPLWAADDTAGAVKGFIRALPAGAVAPVVIGASAVQALLEGTRNQLEPEARKEEKKKYKD